jgi:hypothetical protein
MKKPVSLILVVLLSVAGGVLPGATGCGSDACLEKSCSEYGGDASRSLFSCHISGEGSFKDHFWLEDEEGEEFFRCERAADDNDSCGVELIVATKTYCGGGDASSNGAGSGSGSGGTS